MDAMISKEIRCTYCGLNGELGALNRKFHGLDRKKIFKHLGHNPYSGHLHYQCPSCRVVLLVPPMDILEGKSLRGVPSHPENRPSFAMIFSNILYRIAKFRKVFQRTPAFP